MIRLVQGFDISSPAPIDGRITLSKREMTEISDNILPERYFAICKDDGRLYLYYKGNQPTTETGKFRVNEESVDERIDHEVEVLNERITLEVDTLNDRIDDEVETLNDTVDYEVDILNDRVDNEVSTLNDRINTEVNTLNTRIDNEVADLDTEDVRLDNRITSEVATLNNTIDTKEAALQAEDAEINNKLSNDVGWFINVDKSHYVDSEGQGEFRFTVQLKNSKGEIVSTSDEIDLPLESVVVDGFYDEETKEVVLVLQNQTEIRFSVADLIDGLVSEDTFNAHVNNEDVNHQHIDESERDLIHGALQTTATDLKNHIKAGANVKITSGTAVDKIYIAATDTTYEAGDGITINQVGTDRYSISSASSAPFWDLIQSELEYDSEGNPVLDSEGYPVVLDRGPLSNVQLVQVLENELEPKLDKEEYREEQEVFRAELQELLDSMGELIAEHDVVLDSMGEEIAQEVSNRQLADSTLGSRITEVNNKADANAISINNEISARQGKDNELETAIGAETIARENADTTLQGAIEAEETRAKGIESSLNTAIGDEVSRAQGVESNLSTAIGAEETRATGVESGLNTRLTEVEGDINKTVVKNLESFTQWPDRIVVTHTDINIASGAESYETKDLPLANNENAGLMSPTDVSAIATLQHKVSALEGKSTRLWYQTEEDLATDSEGNTVFYVEYIDEEHGDYIVKYTVTGSTHANLRITAGENSKQAGYVFTPYKTDTEGRSVVSIFEIRNDYDNVDYHFNLSTGHIHRDADAEDINAFAEDHGFVAPFTGLAIVIEHTYHIWRYYPNMENGQVIGWRDDGADTVSQFTNTNAGIIKGAGAIEGKVYAENDGTGSVYGWSTLTTNVANLMNNSATKTELTNGLATKVDKVTNKSLVADSEITRLSGMATGATKVEASSTNGKIKINGTDTTVYTHPNNKSAQSGFKKLTSDTEGHITGGTAVAAADITGLNPYLAGNGLASTTNSGQVTFKSTYESKMVATGLVADGGAWNKVEDSEGSALYYYADIQVEGITDQSNPILDIIISGSDYANVDALNEAWSKIYSGETASGYIRLYANDMPAINFNISIKGY